MVKKSLAFYGTRKFITVFTIPTQSEPLPKQLWSIPTTPQPA